MSVGLFITAEDETISRPVASETFFLIVWLPRARAEKLELVEQLGLGLDVDASTMQPLLAELDRLQERVPLYDDLPSEIKEAWLARLTLLIDTLNEWKNKPYESIYIG